MAIYHSRKGVTGSHAPLCGARGNKGGFNVVTVQPPVFAAMRPELQCKKCLAAMYGEPARKPHAKKRVIRQRAPVRNRAGFRDASRPWVLYRKGEHAPFAFFNNEKDAMEAARMYADKLDRDVIVENTD